MTKSQIEGEIIKTISNSCVPVTAREIYNYLDSKGTLGFAQGEFVITAWRMIRSGKLRMGTDLKLEIVDP